MAVINRDNIKTDASPPKTFYKCLGCGRNKFERMWQAHNCNGQYRVHKFPAGFIVSDWKPTDTSEKIMVMKKELTESNLLPEETKMPFNYLLYIAEQINRLPKGLVLYASHYNTDDDYVIHFWNDSGDSWDIYLNKSACE